MEGPGVIVGVDSIVNLYPWSENACIPTFLPAIVCGAAAEWRSRCCTADSFDRATDSFNSTADAFGSTTGAFGRAAGAVDHAAFAIDRAAFAIDRAAQAAGAAGADDQP